MPLTRRRLLAGSAAAAALAAAPAAALAQRFEAQGARSRALSLPIVAGTVGGTYLRAAADLARVVNQPEALRVLPLVGDGSVQNVTDLLHLQGVDATFVQLDALTAMRDEKLYPNLGQRIRFVTKLYHEEVHVLAGGTVNQLRDLAGRRVNFDLGGSGTAVTATALFSSLGIPVEATLEDRPTALQRLRAGDIAALVFVGGKPVDWLLQLPAASALRLIPVPRTPPLLTTYVPAELTAADYPRLLDGRPPVPTLAVGSAMVVYNWPQESERYRRVARFVALFFERFDELLTAPAHPKWQEVTLAAQLPGWQRLTAAEAQLAARGR